MQSVQAHTVVTRHTGARDQLCLQVGMLSVALSGRIWYLVYQHCREGLSCVGSQRKAQRRQGALG